MPTKVQLCILKFENYTNTLRFETDRERDRTVVDPAHLVMRVIYCWRHFLGGFLSDFQDTNHITYLLLLISISNVINEIPYHAVYKVL